MPTSRKTKKPAVTATAKKKAAPVVKTKPKAKTAVVAAPARKPMPVKAAVVAKPPPVRLNMNDEWVREMRESLLRRREQMRSVVQSNRDQLAEAKKDSADIGDRASEGFEDEMAAGLLSLESAQLDEIEEALHRMDAGTYGVCVDCGKPVPRKRLEILPFAKRCLECEGHKERHMRTVSAADEEGEEGDLD